MTSETPTAATENDLPTTGAPGSDLDAEKSTPSELVPKKASRQILRHEIEEGLDALERPVAGLFAGLDVGFSLFLMAVMLTQAEGTLSKTVGAILVANMYAIGVAKLHHFILGTVEVMAGYFAGQGISTSDIGRFLVGPPSATPSAVSSSWNL